MSGLPGPTPEEAETQRELDKDGTEQEQERSATNRSHSSGSVNHDRHPPANEANGDKQENGSAPTVKPRWTPYERSTIVVQVLTLIALGVYTGVNYHMWRAMDASNEQARETNLSTRLFGLANLVMMEQSNMMTREGIEGSKRQASENLNLGRRSLEASQRAKLALDSIDSFPLVADENGTVAVTVHNSGGSPALDVDSQGVWLIRSQLLPDNYSSGLPHRITFHMVIPAGGDSRIEKPITPISAETIKNIGTGKQFLYLIGWTVYNDGFKRRHLTYCGVHEPNGDGWRVCPNNNLAE